MNNTCRIASGYLGALLARQRPTWDFHDEPLSENGRSALWFITDSNLEVQNINVSQNDISWEDVPGMARMLVTCPKLTKFDISNNQLSTLVETHFSGFHRMCEALANNRSLTDLNMNSNNLGMVGVRMICNSLQSLKGLRRLGATSALIASDCTLTNQRRLGASSALIASDCALTDHGWARMASC
jgi:Ran GTPase-activating protein (RanGAP) involved in mRNA processing and transport